MAKQALAEMKSVYAELADTIDANGDSGYGVWLVRAIERGDALMQIADGNSATGLAALEEAAAAELALPIVFGPPAIYKPSYEILGEKHLANGNKAKAAQAFRNALKLAPGRRLSLEGLKAATSG